MGGRVNYAYMIGTSYSGSTLLALLLDTHPKIVSIGEVANEIRLGRIGESGEIIEYSCSCGRPIRQCDFFRQIRERCAKEGVDLDLHDFQTGLGEDMGELLKRLIFGTAGKHFWLQRSRDNVLRLLPIYRRHLNKVLHRTETIVRVALEVSGKEVFVDGSKGPPKAFHILKIPQFDVRLIHLVRDVRAYVYSCVRKGVRRVALNARTWHRAQTAALELKNRLPSDRYYLLRWEEFCSNPRTGLDSLCKFLGVNSAEMIKTVNDQPHHIIGHVIRLQPVPAIRADESWHEALTPKQLAICDRIAGDLNRFLGY